MASSTLCTGKSRRAEEKSGEEQGRDGDASARTKPHALAVAFPSQGHIGPFMELCIRLASPPHGFRITLASIARNHHVRLQSILQSQPTLSADLHLVDIPSDSPSDISTAGQFAVFDIFTSLRFLERQQGFVQIVGDLLRSRHPLTCILTDFFTPFTRALARKFDLPRIVFFPQSAGTLASYLCVLRRDPPPTPGEVVDYVPGVVALKWSEISNSLQSLDPNHPNFQMITECVAAMEDSPYLLMNTFQALEEASLSCVEERLKRRVFNIGPLLPEGYFDEGREKNHGDEKGGKIVASLWKEDYDCLQWLDKQEDKSVLFVSFGSITVVSSHQFMELALGLEMSLTPILWVIRLDLMIDNKPIVFPDGYLERMHDRLCIVSWAPQKQVLIHRAIGGFLTHCGWNSTLESISAGVPMLGWPYFADQRLNCRQCVDRWEVGLEIQVDDSNLATREEVCRKVRMLMNPSDLSVRENAQIWKRRAHRAIGEEDGSSTIQWKEFDEAFAKLSPKERLIDWPI